ncbi:S-adenosyl-L-methionine-dependent methyltransferase [Abortiporus biennis]|nr:S-adenosyl-L-methionine-dependent methyltransferase [Abortiporus biennis]
MSTTADGRVESRMQNYTKFWDSELKTEGKEHTDNRIDRYSEVINGYYDAATLLYEYCWSGSFHFSRFYKGESFPASLARHEHYLAAQMNLKPGMKVLDVGCGVGGPAREIARFADVNITGITINDYQISRANKHAKQAGLQNQLNFVQGDFMKLVEKFGENSFDAVYAIEATVHAPSWEGVYDQIRRVLKPGGIFGVYEWCMTDKWDPSIPRHKELAHRIEIGNGIPEMRPIRKVREALTKVGFEVVHEEDLAERPDEVTWYYPLEGDLFKAQTPWDLLTCWRTSASGRFVTHHALWWIEKIGIVPSGTYDVCETLKIAGDAIVEGGHDKLFTPMYLVISKKPE